jgi:beta-glucanase (GH16 family)
MCLYLNFKVMQKACLKPNYLIIPILFIGLLLINSTELKAQCRDLAWSDEFDEDGLPDPTKWWYSVGGDGWGNNELEYYTAERSQNARVENGSLIIEAHNETFGNNQYTSAKLNSKFSLKYGRVEMKAILPHGRGTWAAMWMLPVVWNYGNGGWPDNGEIDILEYVGHDPDVPHASNHTHTYNWANNNVKTNWTTAVKGLETSYHIYALEWDSTKMDYYIDNLKYLTVYNDKTGWQEWPFDKEFYLIINLAIGGSWGGEKGVDNTIFPTKYVIDYVRMYADPAEYLPITGPTKVFKDSTYTYSVPADASATYNWVLPSSATAISNLDSNAIIVKWSDAGNLKVSISKNCDEFTRDVDVKVYDPTIQLPFGGTPWPIPGKIEVENFDTGGEGMAYYDKSPGNNGPSKVRDGEDTDLGNCNDVGGTSNLGWTDGGEWLEYTVEVTADGYYDFNFRVATVNTGGLLHVEFDGVDVTGTVEIPNSGDWQNWITKTVHYIPLKSGQHLMREVIDWGGFDINYFNFTEGTKVTGQINPQVEAMPVNLSPNPTTSNVQLSVNLSSCKDIEVTVTDLLGKIAFEKVYSNPDLNFNCQLDVSQLVPGTYLVRFIQGEQVYYSKLIKK